ncbi:hypothetical protein [Micromonospora chersina]|uniref:hypothetical protein n=1 Tax=Micromonospora chersina TaxID=47854 RepID=UPI003D8AFB18
MDEVNLTEFAAAHGGNRSLAAAQFLARAGIDARSVAGGTGEWLRTGRAVATGADA